MDASLREANWIKCIARMLLFAASRFFGRDTKTSRRFINLARANRLLVPQTPMLSVKVRFALGYATCATAKYATLPDSAKQGSV
jgi:hypothetical protein